MKQTITLTDISNQIRALSVLFEEFLSREQLLVEVVSSMREQTQHIPAMRQDLDELTADVRLIKHAVRDTNRDLHAVEQRLDRAGL